MELKTRKQIIKEVDDFLKDNGKENDNIVINIQVEEITGSMINKRITADFFGLLQL